MSAENPLQDKVTEGKAEAARRRAGVAYRLEGLRGWRARRRATRALLVLDRRLVRLAKQIALCLAWHRFVYEGMTYQQNLADQPTSHVVHVLRKIGVIVAELAFTFLALQLAGVSSPNLRLILAIALGGLLVLTAQTIARTTKTAHLASQDGKNLEKSHGTEDAVASPSLWDWVWTVVSIGAIASFAIALTVLRAAYSRAQESAAAVSHPSHQLVVVAPHHDVPAWVFGVLALVAPLIGLLAEYAQYDPRAHRLRRGLRLFAWNTRKLRYIMRRAARATHRGRRALLSYDHPRSRAQAMAGVIDTKYEKTPFSVLPQSSDADEPVHQLRARIKAYDRMARRVTLLLLRTPQDKEVTATGGDLDGEMLSELRPENSVNGKMQQEEAL